MDRRKWFPTLPFFRAPTCCYCGGPADTSDHTPPRCLLPKKLPNDVQAMTIPACSACNGGYAADEMRVAAVVCTVSFTQHDRDAVAVGGWVHSALQADSALNDFIGSRLDADGVFRPNHTIFQVFSRIMAKTATGLLFHEFGKLIPPGRLEIVAIEHAENVHPLAMIEQHRRDDGLWAEVTPSCRELERQVLALDGQPPPNMPKWRVYIPDFFEYLFIRRSNNMLLTAMNLHNALTVLVECPWPTRAGPRRRGRPPKTGRA
jgi:hypothetical protein